ncbi:MAG: hypothetical protein RIQ86_369, partial [Actinomycetota bacterium]
MKKLISAFLVVSGLAFLTACDAGTAAQIGETKISVNTVQSRIAEINDARREFDTSQIQLVVGEELNRTQVRFLVIAEIFKKLANKNGIEITQAMKDSRKAEIFNSIGGADQLDQALVSAQMAPSDFDLYIEALLISDKLVERAVAAGIAEADAQTAIQQLVLEFTKT